MANHNNKLTFWLFSFFSNYLWLGIVIVLSTALADEYFTQQTYVIKVAIKLFESIGIAIVVASIFTFASGTSQFVNKIQTLLQDIVVNRNFLGNIDSGSKRDALNALIKPSSEEKRIYSNIEDYLNTYITQTMDVTKKCVRSNYNVSARAYIDNKTKKVAVFSKISYRLFPTTDGYSDIQLGFMSYDTLSSCESIIINTPHGERKKYNSDELEFIEKTLDGGEVRLATVDLNSYGKLCSHLDIEINMIEYGADHWILLSFQALQPTDGFKHHLRCEDGLTINEYASFVHGARFYVDKRSDNEISTSCNEWINEGTGISIIISQLHEIDPINDAKVKSIKKNK